MKTWLVAALAVVASAVSPSAQDRVRLTFDTSEAEAVLAIAANRAAGSPIADGEWSALFATPPYIRLKEREASMKRDFTDADFQQFVLSPDTLTRAPLLRQTLDAWKRADLTAAATRVLAFLPGDAVIRAKVYPTIKPRDNSFVYGLRDDPTIFFYLDPAKSAAAFENMAAHELHHIGLASLGARYDTRIAALPGPAHLAAQYVAAFGEGLAMLAAAGSAAVHPHRDSPPADRERWDRDSARFNDDLREVERFFLDVVHGRLTGDDEIAKRGSSFFGVQGPWYTVGYRMAAEVERQRGRAALLACTEDPRSLLATWNQIAAAHNAARSGDVWARWSDELLTALQAGSAQ